VTGKALYWVGSALEDLRAFPVNARRQAGYQLRRVQQGLMPDDWRPMSAVGAGVYEIRLDVGTAHRVFYVAKFRDAVYVLHSFEERTRRTRRADLELARQRLAAVQALRRRR
jgi:phage-related protein